MLLALSFLSCCWRDGGFGWLFKSPGSGPVGLMDSSRCGEWRVESMLCRAEKIYAQHSENT